MRKQYNVKALGYSRVGFTVYPKKYAHGFRFAVLCCGYTLTDFPISIRLTSLALWQSNDCPSASKATLMDMDKYFMWIHYERLHNHNKAKHNKTVCIFHGLHCICESDMPQLTHRIQYDSASFACNVPELPLWEGDLVSWCPTILPELTFEVGKRCQTSFVLTDDLSKKRLDCFTNSS